MAGTFSIHRLAAADRDLTHGLYIQPQWQHHQALYRWPIHQNYFHISTQNNFSSLPHYPSLHLPAACWPVFWVRTRNPSLRSVRYTRLLLCIVHWCSRLYPTSNIRTRRSRIRKILIIKLILHIIQPKLLLLWPRNLTLKISKRLHLTRSALIGRPHSALRLFVAWLATVKTLALETGWAQLYGHGSVGCTGCTILRELSPTCRLHKTLLAAILTISRESTITIMLI